MRLLTGYSLTKTKMKIKIKVSLAAVIFLLLPFMQYAMAAQNGAVVINEVAWAGSRDSANDEWIELYNPGSLPIDLAGWKIVDDQGAQVYPLSGTIAAGGYYLIEDSEVAVQPLAADKIINLSLSNAGDSLVLIDDAGQVIDSVNSSGGMWVAGSATTYQTMERIDPAISGDLASNWVSSDGSLNTAVSSAGSLIRGTPGKVNSASKVISAPRVDFSLSSLTPAKGEMVTLYGDVKNAINLFSYGVEVNYDPTLLKFVSAEGGDFLSSNGEINTNFESGLEDGEEGRLLIAQAIMRDVKTGVSGAGRLFAVKFSVVGNAGLSGNLVAGTGSFLGGISGDLVATWIGSQFTVAQNEVLPVSGALVFEDVQRYALKLTWTAPAEGIDKYKVLRKNPHGLYRLLGESTSVSFVDSDMVPAGGKIIPGLQYCYRVIAVKGEIESDPVEVCGKETRGLKADYDRSDRVDGRDLDKIARHFAQTDAVADFDALTDTNYDGQTDGSDLIDLGINFARVYMP